MIKSITKTIFRKNLETFKIFIKAKKNGEYNNMML